MAMHHSAPGEEDEREPRPDGGPSAGPARSGLTGFLVDDPTSIGLSREELGDAVHSLIRERDYLRSVRDIQMAESRAQVEELTRERDALLSDRDTWRDRANRAEARLARSLSGRVKRGLLWLLRLGR